MALYKRECIHVSVYITVLNVSVYMQGGHGVFYSACCARVWDLSAVLSTSCFHMLNVYHSKRVKPIVFFNGYAHRKYIFVLLTANTHDWHKGISCRLLPRWLKPKIYKQSIYVTTHIPWCRHLS